MYDSDNGIVFTYPADSVDTILAPMLEARLIRMFQKVFTQAGITDVDPATLTPIDANVTQTTDAIIDILKGERALNA